eukprot:GHVU01137934.1.p1 GENE.GHVU01137934.1~~GHVU01137934.1.p1  ORF type:complete len:151 (+),score=10.47 GHVU01137934.1:615-1067(+)
MDSGDLSKAIKMAYSDPVDIKIAVVSPAGPTKPYDVSLKVKIGWKHTNPDFYRTAWLETLIKALDIYAGKNQEFNMGLGEASYQTGRSWEETGLSLYMMTATSERKWYLLSDPSESKPTQDEFESALPQFVVTGPQVRRQQRRGCFCIHR